MELTTAAYRGPGIERATDHLRTQRPEMSASRVLTRGQKIALAVAAAVLVAAFALWPLGTATALLAAMTTYYLVNSLYKFKLAFDSLSGAGTIDVSDEEVAAVDERTLPRYTMLVPLYKEAGIVGLLTHNIGGSTTRPPSSRSCCCARRTTTRRSRRSRPRTCRTTTTSSASPTASRGPSRRRATTGCCSPAASCA